MSPTREKTVEADNIRFSPQTIWAVIVVAFLFGGAQYMFARPDREAQAAMQASQAQMQSDIRNIGTILAGMSTLRDADQKLLDERFARIKDKAEADERVRNVLLDRYDKSNTEFQKKMLQK